MTDSPPDSVWQPEPDRPLITTPHHDEKAMWMAQAEALGISPDMAAAYWDALLAISKKNEAKK